MGTCSLSPYHFLDHREPVLTCCIRPVCVFMFYVLLSLVLLIAVILCGGMITILERKVLGMSHRRVSLNSAGW